MRVANTGLPPVRDTFLQKERLQILDLAAKDSKQGGRATFIDTD